jgi:16S rRNA (cytosine1402-N4)-methyltransferase
MSSQGSREILPHLPVLYNEIITAIHPVSSGCYIDGTVGAGGHAWGILEASRPTGKLLGLDVDPQALALAAQRLSVFGDRVTLVASSYKTMDQQVARLGWPNVQGILLDLGVSSMQFDTPQRGFSFQADGPLDMRFDPANPLTAAVLVNTLSEGELADLIWKYGEEHLSRKIAQAVIHSRPIETTHQLAEVISQSVGNRRGKIHPATRTFQALRIAVNQELQVLEAALPRSLEILASGGRLAVIAFHSLEDRMVKQFFRRESQDCICPPDQPVCTCGHHASVRLVYRHAVQPSEAEINQNPRARSARLRVIEKL